VRGLQDPQQEGAVVVAGSAGGQAARADAGQVAAGADQLTKVANDRKLNVDDLLAAAKTYMPSGRHDDYVLFSSGGQSGQVFAIGVPSMRLLRSIAVFTPESWQGYGFAGEGTACKRSRSTASPSRGATRTTRPVGDRRATTTGSSCSSATRPTPAWA
jgi:nitrous oxide reductase